MLGRDFYQLCEDIAAQMRHRVRLKSYEPLPARVLAMDQEVDILTPAELTDLTQEDIAQAVRSEGWSAITVTTEPPQIIIHPQHLAEQFESDVMHELAHLLLKHKPEMLGNISSQRVARRYNKTQETQADTLADCLQFPLPALYFVNQKGWTQAQIIDHFCISAACLKRRLVLF